jgi:hypothetical protein
MESIKTMYRIVVMAATLAIVAMGWRLYGPSTDQCKSIALRGVEYVESLLRSPDHTSKNAAAPPMAKLLAGPEPAAAFDSPPLLLAADPAGNRPQISQASDPAVGGLSTIPGGAQNVAPTGEEARLKGLFDQLAQLDVQGPHLSAWGANRQLYRFQCRATWGDSPQISRHFEAVAPEPVQAVQYVLAQVNSWRAAETAR